MWKGDFKYKETLPDEKPRTAIMGVPIRNVDIKGYLNPFFWSCLRAYSMTKMWGLAYGGMGWAEQPKAYIDAITLIESELNLIEREEMDKRQAEMERKREEQSTKKR